MAQSVFMKKLREKMGVIFIIVGLLFIGMMVFQWGMDITGRSRQKTEEAIAKVGQSEITLRQYNDEWRAQENRFYERNITLDQFQRENMMEQVFQIMINRELLNKEFDKKGVKEVTGREIYERLRRNPPDFVINNPSFQTNGKFDYNKYINALNNPAYAKDWVPVEQYIASEMPIERMKVLARTMSFVTMSEAMDQFFLDSAYAKGEYLKIGPDCLGSEQVDTSEEAIKNYYERNRDKLPKQPYAIFAYVEIPYLPSPKDTADAYEEAKTVYNRLKSGEDFGDLAEAYSKDYQTAQKGGDIGFIKLENLFPQIAEAIAKLDTGQFTEPIQTQNGFHIVKLEEVRTVEDTVTGTVDTFYHIRHIMITIEPGYETADSIEKLAQKVVDYAREHGIYDAAKKFGLQVKTTPPVHPNEAIPGIGLRTLINTFAFQEGPGAVPDVVRSQGKYFVLQVIEATPPKLETVEDYRDIIKKMIIQDAKKEICRKVAHKAYQMARAKTPFKKIAETLGLEYGIIGPIHPVEVLKDTAKIYDPWLVGALSGLKSDSLSGVIEADSGKFYIVHLLERKKVDYSHFKDAAPQIRQSIFKIKQENAYDMWLANLRRKVPIEDLRLKYIDIGQKKEETETPPETSATTAEQETSKGEIPKEVSEPQNK